MANMREIAAQAGVSVTTVSLVLSGKARQHRIGAATALRVQRVVDACGYRPNYHGRATHRGCSDLVAYTGPGLDPTLFGAGIWQGVAAGIEAAARENGCDLLLTHCNAGEQRALTFRALDAVMEGRVDALVLPAFTHTERWLAERPVSAGLPVIMTGGTHPERHAGVCPGVYLDERPGLAGVADHLARLGHRELLWVETKSEREAGRADRCARGQNFAAEAARNGLAVRTIALEIGVAVPNPSTRTVPTTIEACRTAFLSVSDALRGETALMCYNDHIALGVLAALRDLGLRVPEDVSVVGFDDLYAPLADPPLTVVSHELFLLGHRACELALERRRCGTHSVDDRAQVHLVPARLVIRASTGRAAR